jgi:hypothetical protein
MKNTIRLIAIRRIATIQRIVGIIALVAIIGLTVIACGGGGGNPKSLAKEGYTLMRDMEKLINEGKINDPSDPAVVSYTKKTEALNAKVEKLSEADKEILMAELERLAQEDKKK